MSELKNLSSVLVRYIFNFNLLLSLVNVVDAFQIPEATSFLRFLLANTVLPKWVNCSTSLIFLLPNVDVPTGFQGCLF